MEVHQKQGIIAIIVTAAIAAGVAVGAAFVGIFALKIVLAVLAGLAGLRAAVNTIHLVTHWNSERAYCKAEGGGRDVNLLAALNLRGI